MTLTSGQWLHIFLLRTRTAQHEPLSYQDIVRRLMTDRGMSECDARLAVAAYRLQAWMHISKIPTIDDEFEC